MTHVLLVLLDRHRHLGHRPALPVRWAPTPPQLGAPAKSVITILFLTKSEQLHAKGVPQVGSPIQVMGRVAHPVRQGNT